MGSMRRHVPVLALYLGVFFACVGLAALPACTGSQRSKTLRASVLAVNAARDGMLVYDATHQKAIVDKATSREEGERELAAYYTKRTPVVAAFEVAYRALAVAATANDDPSYRAALAAAKSALDALQALTGGS